MSDYIIDQRAPNRIRKFFKEYLRHGNGEFAGKPFELLEWQWEIIKDVYGTFLPDGRRRYRTVYIEIPRKQGKSTLISGLCLYSLFEEKGAQVFAGAASREQASILFNIAAAMVQTSPQLKKILRVFKHSIYYPKNNSFFRVISRDAHTALGTNPSFAVLDELLVQPDDSLYSSLKTGMISRRNPLLFCITTAAENKASFCGKMHEHTEEVNAGIVEDESFYGRIWGLKEGEDWEDEANWYKCNPSLGHTITIENFRTEFQQAKSMPGMSYQFKSKNLNAWLSSEKTWITTELWATCADENLKIEDFKGETCYAGLDLSSVADLTALVLCFPKNGKYHFFPYIFCPAENIARRSRVDKVPYKEWADAGYLIATEGNRVDQQVILDKMIGLSKDYNIKEAVYDRWNATMLVTKLQENGFEPVSMGQGFYSMSEPAKLLEKLALGKELVHPNNKLYNWTMNNVILEIDAAGNYKPNKRKSRDRIDPIAASIMALARAAMDTGVSITGNISFV